MRHKQPCEKDCSGRTAECKRTCPRWAEYEAKMQIEYADREQKFKLADDLLECAKRRGKRKTGVNSWSR